MLGAANRFPSEYLRGRTALERHGALVFQAKQCHNCHSLDNKGGQRGPALDSVVYVSPQISSFAR